MKDTDLRSIFGGDTPEEFAARLEHAARASWRLGNESRRFDMIETASNLGRMAREVRRIPAEVAWARTTAACRVNSNWAQCARCIYGSQCAVRIEP